MVKTAHQKIDEENTLDSDTPETKKTTASSETSTETNQTQITKDSPSSPEKTGQDREEIQNDLVRNSDTETQKELTPDEQTEEERRESSGESAVTDTVSKNETSATSPCCTDVENSHPEELEPQEKNVGKEIENSVPVTET